LQTWDPIADELARSFEVIAVDLPGFGNSPPLPDGIAATPAALAERLGELLGELDIERAHVAGNSLGGWVGLELALQGFASSVTALCPAGLWRGPLNPAAASVGRTQRAVRLARPLIPAAMATPWARSKILAAFVAHPERVPYSDARRMADAYARATAYEATNDAMRAGRFTQLADITVPVTVVFATLDRLIRPATITAPNVRTVLLEDCGHVPMWDQPERTVQLIAETAA
jgi:pimeloyl-ACP methyl ester carboxylesterase